MAPAQPNVYHELQEPNRPTRAVGALAHAFTLTLFVCVVGRPFVLRTIVKVAAVVLPFGAFTGIVITVVLPAATFTEALPETPLPLSVATAATCAGHATPGSANFTFALPLTTAIVPGTLARLPLLHLGEPDDAARARVHRVQIALRPDGDVLADEVGRGGRAEQLAARREPVEAPLRDVRHPEVAVEIDADAGR